MKKEIKILFLGGAKRVSVAERFIAAGGKLGKTVKILSYELSDDVPISFVGEVLAGLKWKDPELFSHLESLIRSREIDIVVPFLDPSTIIAAQLKEKMEDVFIPVSGMNECEIFFDKIRANDWFLAHGFPVPSMPGFPRIAKPRQGSASKGIVVFDTPEALEVFKKANPDADRNYLIQKFIKGEELSVDCYLSSEGKVISVVPRKRLEVAGGEVVKSSTVRDPGIIELSRKMLVAAGVRGPVTIQFIRDTGENKDYFMEVNPRLGGGVVTSIGAGADITEMILKDFLKMPLEEVADWKDNYLMIRTYREFFRHADHH